MTTASIIGLILIACNVATGGLWLYQKLETEKAKLELSSVKEQLAIDVSVANRENAKELSRLVTANNEIQNDLNHAKASISNMAIARANSAGLRESERLAIVAAAERSAAGACGRYATEAERHIAGVEDAAIRLGQEASGASATAHALNQTLDQRRASLNAKRNEINPQAKEPK